MKTELEIAKERILELEEQVKKLTSNTMLADSAFFPTTSITKMKEGYYTDNFNTYYIDSEGKKHLR